MFSRGNELFKSHCISVCTKYTVQGCWYCFLNDLNMQSDWAKLHVEQWYAGTKCAFVSEGSSVRRSSAGSAAPSLCRYSPSCQTGLCQLTCNEFAQISEYPALLSDILYIMLVIIQIFKSRLQIRKVHIKGAVYPLSTDSISGQYNPACEELYDIWRSLSKLEKLTLMMSSKLSRTALEIFLIESLRYKLEVLGLKDGV